MDTNLIKSQLNDLIQRYPVLSPCGGDIGKAFSLMETAFSKGGKLLCAGNGGSAADSDHIVGELMKGFLLKRPLPKACRERFLNNLPPEDAAFLAEHLQGGLPAFSLTSHAALLTATLNDNEPELVFAQQVYACGKPEDLLLLLSTSGNSGNVVRAAQTAKALGIPSVAITGTGGGALSSLCDVTIRLPACTTPEIQELTLPVYHTLCAMAEAAFFGEEN